MKEPFENFERAVFALFTTTFVPEPDVDPKEENTNTIEAPKETTKSSEGPGFFGRVFTCGAPKVKVTSHTIEEKKTEVKSPVKVNSLAHKMRSSIQKRGYCLQKQ